MKALSSILFFLFGTLSSGLFAQNLPDQKPNNFLNTKREGEWVIWYNAKSQRTNFRDSVKYYTKVIFKNGIPQGMVYDFYLSGKIHWQSKLSSFEPLVREGKASWFYENGNKLSERNFANGKLNGELIDYYKSGKIEFTSNYTDGLREGYEIKYHENGTIKIKGKNGYLLFNKNHVEESINY